MESTLNLAGMSLNPTTDPITQTNNPPPKELTPKPTEVQTGDEELTSRTKELKLDDASRTGRDPIDAEIDNQSLGETIALPLQVRRRKVRQLPDTTKPSILTQPSDDSNAVAYILQLMRDNQVTTEELSSGFGTCLPFPPGHTSSNSSPPTLSPHYGNAEIYILQLMRHNKITVEQLGSGFGGKLDCSFSQAKFSKIAQFFNLNPNDNLNPGYMSLHVHRFRLPLKIVKQVYQSLDVANRHYGDISMHPNEKARSRWLASITGALLWHFRGKIINTPKIHLRAEITKGRGRIEHLFFAFGSVTILFIEIESILGSGPSLNDVIAQVLAESDACDFVNNEKGFWVPILGVLTDGKEFYFFAYDSSSYTVARSRSILGVVDIPRIRVIAELLFDFFLTGYCNSLHALQQQSMQKVKAQGTKRPSLPGWSTALETARRALKAGRLAAATAAQGDIGHAADLADRAWQLVGMGIDEDPRGEIKSLLDEFHEMKDEIETV